MFAKKSMVITTIGLLVLMAGNVQSKGNVQRGGDLTNDCIECHKMDGTGDFETPSIAGLDEVYLVEKLRAFYGHKQESLDDLMHLYTEDRTDQDLQDLAAYWAAQEK